MINCGLIDVLCLVFINCQNTETLEKIADFWFDFFHCFDRYEKVPEREVSQVCFVLNFMLHQKEGVVSIKNYVWPQIAQPIGFTLFRISC